LDRGPLWFDGFGTIDHFQSFTQEFARQFPPRLGRKRRYIPEIEDSEHVRAILKQNGFKRSFDEAYQTIWLDLRKDVNDLRAGLKKSWRNTLSKAERSAVTWEWGESGESLGYELR